MKNKVLNLFYQIVLIIAIVSFNPLSSMGQSPVNKTSSKSLKMAGLQMNVTTTISENKKIIIENIKQVASEGATFMVTPEGSLSGYHARFDQEELLQALQEVLSVAKQNHIGLFLGTCYKEMIAGKEITYNQVRVYAPDGSLLGIHSKILLCSPVHYPGTGEMHDYGQGTLNTIKYNGHAFGVLICNDLWATPGYTTLENPYLPLKLHQLGAEVIIHTINSGKNQFYRKFHESSAELWAHTLGIPIMEVNAAKNSIPVNAESGLINKEGVRTVRVPDMGEQLFYCEIDFNGH